jgi:ferredoxin
LIVIIIAIFIGRAFCGWVCPLGTLNHFISALWTKRKKRVEYISYQRAKYYVLAGLLACACTTSLQVGLLDPLCILFRGLALSFEPGLSYSLTQVLDTLSQGKGLFQDVSNMIYQILGHILPSKGFHFHQAWFLGLILFGVLFMNRVMGRFWCRFLCPLGALLGLFAKLSLLRKDIDTKKCSKCRRCLTNCGGALTIEENIGWRGSECILCFNCEANCPQNAIYSKFYNLKRDPYLGIDIDRRKMLTSSIGGTLFFPIARASTSIIGENPYLIRPPGVLSESEFIKRCVKCGQCIKICPTNALHPTLFEAGLEGIWTPILIPRIGYCEYSCILCSTVCPTGAIPKITEAEKTGKKGPPIKMGLAFYNRGRCLPWAAGISCIVCEEFCPTSPKAIWFKEVTWQDQKGKEKRIKRPYVNPKRCIGCGTCENICPLKPAPGIYVVSLKAVLLSSKKHL